MTWFSNSSCGPLGPSGANEFPAVLPADQPLAQVVDQVDERLAGLLIFVGLPELPVVHDDDRAHQPAGTLRLASYTSSSVLRPYHQKLPVISTSKQRRTGSGISAPDWSRRERV